VALTFLLIQRSQIFKILWETPCRYIKKTCRVSPMFTQSHRFAFIQMDWKHILCRWLPLLTDLFWVRSLHNPWNNLEAFISILWMQIWHIVSFFTALSSLTVQERRKYQ
jgi:hypothetical protein